jgi:hypothetical protein
VTTAKPKKRRIGRTILITLVVLILVVAIGTPLVQSMSPFGAELSGERLARAQANPQFSDGRFVNPLPPAPYTWAYVRDLLAGQFGGDEARGTASTSAATPATRITSRASAPSTARSTSHS